MEALKKVEEEVLAVEHEIEAQLVTHNTVGSVTIPSTPPLAVSAPYLLLLGLMMGAMALTDRAIRQRTPVKIVTREFRTFQRSYINVYLCALGAEWLQDSHLFALLLRHGHALDAVASLFAASFVVSYAWGLLTSCLPGGASAFFGGRRNACVVCFALYGLASTTVFHDDYQTLLVGRILYGTATALLHTAFDAWMSAQHAEHAFPRDWQMQTYQEVSRWTAVVSIGAGVLAEAAAAVAGLAAPFVASFLLAIGGVALIHATWDKQQVGGSALGGMGGMGGGGGSVSCIDGSAIGAIAGGVSDSIRTTAQLVSSVSSSSSSSSADAALLPQSSSSSPSPAAAGRGALHLVVVQACFETAMYIALFMWTPVLNASAAEHFGIGIPPPYGIIFSLLMTSVMLGSHAFQIAAGIAADLMQAQQQDGSSQAPPVNCLKPESLCSAICGTAGAACLLLAVLGDSAHWVGLGALLLFEFCSGVYYPAIGTLKGKYVPMEYRSTVAHLAKSLLAALVLTLLLNFATMASVVFLACAVLLGACLFTLHHAAADFDAEEANTRKQRAQQQQQQQQQQQLQQQQH